MADKTYDRETYTTDFFKADTSRAVFMGDVVTDNMMTAIVALGAEVWASNQRQKILEALLAEKGVTAEMIESFKPSEEQRAQWSAERDEFVKRTVQVLGREGDLKTSSPWPGELKK